MRPAVTYRANRRNRGAPNLAARKVRHGNRELFIDPAPVKYRGYAEHGAFKSPRIR